MRYRKNDRIIFCLVARVMLSFDTASFVSLRLRTFPIALERSAQCFSSGTTLGRRSAGTLTRSRVAGVFVDFIMAECVGVCVLSYGSLMLSRSFWASFSVDRGLTISSSSLARSEVRLQWAKLFSGI